MRLSTSAAMAASPCWAGKPRARSFGPMIALYLPTAVSIVRMQPAKRLALAIRTGRDGVADLDLAVGDDDAVDQQLEQRTPPSEVGAGQALAHAPAERLGDRKSVV